MIFSRVIGLQVSCREVDFKDVLSCELAPTALFDDSSKEFEAIKESAFICIQEK